MIMDLLLIVLFVIFIVGLRLLFKSKYNNKHSNNIIKAEEIRSKINTFIFEGQKIKYLRKIDPFVFEELLLNFFEKKGFIIKRNTRYTGDNGIDGIIYDTNKKPILIQAKRYSNYVNPLHIKSFENLVLTTKSPMGYFIHTGKTGKMTYKSAKNIEIISGSKLLNLLK